MRIVIREDISCNGYAVWLIDYRGDTAIERFVAKPMQLEFAPVGNSWELPEPTIRIPHYQFYRSTTLIDSLIEELERVGLMNKYLRGKETIDVLKESTKDHINSLNNIILTKIKLETR